MPVERSSIRATDNKLHRKPKVAAGRSGGLSDGVRDLEVKKRGSKKVQSRVNNDGDVPYVTYVNVYEKSNKSSSEGKRGEKLKSRTGNEGLEAVVDRNSGRKRKRIDAATGKSVDRTHECNLKKYKAKPVFKDEKRVIRSNFDNESKVTKGKGREFEKLLLTGSSNRMVMK